MRRVCSWFLAALLLVVAAAGGSLAQTFLFQEEPKDRPQAGVRFLRPDTKHGEGLTMLSGIYDFRVSLPVTGKWSVMGSLPYLTASSESDEDDADQGLGNLFIGVQKVRSSEGRSRSITSLGVFLPTAEDDFGMAIFGVLTNYEQYYRYNSDYTTLYGNAAFFYDSPSGARFGYEVGPDIMIYTGDRDGDHEFLVHYGVTAGIATGDFLAMVELVGLFLGTSSGGNLSTITTHSLAFGASYDSRHFTPGLFYKIFLDEDFRDLFNGVLGINLEATF